MGTSQPRPSQDHESQTRFLTLRTAVNMGRVFGNLGVRMRGVITYSLSPYEQKSFAGAFSKGFPNLIGRFCRKVVIVGGPLTLGYQGYEYILKMSAEMSRKGPAEFANDS